MLSEQKVGTTVFPSVLTFTDHLFTDFYWWLVHKLLLMACSQTFTDVLFTSFYWCLLHFTDDFNTNFYWWLPILTFTDVLFTSFYWCLLHFTDDLLTNFSRFFDYFFWNIHHSFLSNHLRLSYKYHRLIDSSQTRDGELPASEKCALEDGEEEEDEVLLLFVVGQIEIFFFRTTLR